jgi:predicted Zn-dependent protease with MMP-like domain
MYTTDDEGFEKIVAWAIDDLPKEYIDNLRNVAITIEDEPTREQRIKQKLHPSQTLFGLYEGIPRPARGNAYSLVIPDRITIFKRPLEAWSHSIEELMQRTRNTVWHEIAHHYGLGHGRIHELERKKFAS